MEDTYCHVDKIAGDPSAGFFGVFDGHGGQEVARFTEKHYADVLRS